MQDSKTDATIGYFTVVDDERNGCTGGLLVLDQAGRPIEFQCTLPVRPTRTHEILFGPTLKEHVIGQVVGKALIKRCRTPLTILCVDQPEALTIDSFCTTPVALVREAAEFDEGPISPDMLNGIEPVEVAGATLFVPLENADLIAQLAQSFEDLPDAVEPFARIREAIQEAQSQLARQRPEAA
ncbi:MAG: hypothetical protein AAFU85_31605 [Planctomycetota bacterium]